MGDLVKRLRNEAEAAPPSGNCYLLAEAAAALEASEALVHDLKNSRALEIEKAVAETKTTLEYCDLEAKISRAEAQRNTLADALKFYAMDINWVRHDGLDAKLMRDDRGWRARAALKVAGVEAV